MREVSLPEAAVLLGLTREGVRRRLLKGRLEGRKSNETKEWIVSLPDEVWAPTVADGSPTVGNDGQELRVQLARLEERLAATDRLLAEREGTIADLRQERDRLLDELVAACRPWWRRWISN